MIEKMFIQVIGILSVGHLINSFFYKDIDNLDKLDLFVNSIVTGYAALIIPSVLFSYFFEGLLGFVMKSYFGVSMIASLWFLFTIGKSIHKTDLDHVGSIFGNYYVKLEILLLLGYLFISLLYPLRGWDALHFYTPNAYYFYLVDDIPPGVNPLSFFPTFKPPTNTLLITYGFYVTQNFTPHLHPFVFILGTTFIVYQLTKKYTQSIEIPHFAVILFLTLPLTYFLIYEYAFYQEPPLLFFYSYAIYKVLTYSKNPYDLALIATGISMAILSKMSGYSLLIILPILLPSSSINKKYYQLYTIGIGIFLLRKVMVDQYFLMGIGVFIPIIALLIIQNDTPSLDFKPKEFLMILSFPVAIGLLWLLFMIKIPFVDQFLLNTYINSSRTSLDFVFNASGPYSTYFENGMQVSFYSSLLYIFTGSLLGLQLLPFKLFGLFENGLSHIKLWFLSFFAIWYALFGAVSARYLIPILVPLSILTAFGINRFFEYINLKEIKTKLIFFMIISITSLIFLFPFFPIRFIAQPTNPRFFYYHKNIFLLLIYVLLILSFILFIKNKIISSKFISRNKIITSMIIIFGLIPFSPQYGYYVYSGFNQDQFQKEMNYYNRDNYDNLIKKINTLDIPKETIILSVNTPGLEYFVLLPVLDLLVVQQSSNITFELFTTNVTNALQIIDDHNIHYIIELNTTHVYYPEFISQFSHLGYFQLTQDDMFFDLIYFNPEFKLFKYLS